MASQNAFSAQAGQAVRFVGSPGEQAFALQNGDELVDRIFMRPAD